MPETMNVSKSPEIPTSQHSPSFDIRKMEIPDVPEPEVTIEVQTTKDPVEPTIKTIKKTKGPAKKITTKTTAKPKATPKTTKVKSLLPTWKKECMDEEKHKKLNNVGGETKGDNVSEMHSMRKTGCKRPRMAQKEIEGVQSDDDRINRRFGLYN